MNWILSFLGNRNGDRLTAWPAKLNKKTEGDDSGHVAVEGGRRGRANDI